MLDYREFQGQVGHMVILSVSGGRMERVSDTVLRFPVSNGYAVEVELNEGADTYTVRRTFTRRERGKTVRRVKGEMDGVYCDEVSDAFYYAGMFRSYEEGEWQVKAKYGQVASDSENWG